MLIEVGGAIDDVTHRGVREIYHQLASERPTGVVEVVPALASVAVYYDPASIASVVPGAISYDTIVGRIRERLGAGGTFAVPPSRTVEVPVCYGGELGPDLQNLARAHGLSERDAISLHSGGEYTVHMLGFMPGFPYLGGMDDRLATPRRPTPRTMVDAGSVGIGGRQTGIYPIASPGGWHLIGRTPLRLFTPETDPPTLLRIGDRVRFREITVEQFKSWAH